MIEKKIQLGGWSFKSWKSIRKRVKRWWQEDLDATHPRRKISNKV